MVKAVIETRIVGLEDRLFVGRHRERDVFRAWLLAETPLAPILNISGPGGIGKSALLSAFQRMAPALGYAVLRLDGRDLRPSAESLLSALYLATRAARQMDDASVSRGRARFAPRPGGRSTRRPPTERVIAALNRLRPLILIDTFEAMAPLIRTLQQEVLPHLHPGVRIVIAGRHPLNLDHEGWGRSGAWHALVQPLPLSGLSTMEGDTYLQQRGIADERLRGQMLAATGRHPLALVLATDLALQAGVRDFDASAGWRLVLRTLVERLLSDVEDPDLRAVLESASIVRQFDEELLAEVCGREEIAHPFARLARLAIVRPAAQGLMLHDEVRPIIAGDLRWRRPERYATLRLNALAAYRRRMAAAGPELRERLVGDELYLWGHALAQRLLFADVEPDAVWIEPGGLENEVELLDLYRRFQENVYVVHTEPEAQAATRAIFAAQLRLPGVRVRLARMRGGKLVGASLVLPLIRELLPTLHPRGPVMQLITASMTPAQIAALPVSPERSRAFVLAAVLLSGEQREAAQSALIREMMGMFALGGLYLCSSAVPEYNRMLEALGFDRLDAARNRFWTGDLPMDGFVLDLRRLGVEPWIAALIEGRRPPLALSAVALEQELQAVLRHWHDDEALRASLLLRDISVVQRLGEERQAADLRGVVREALDSLRGRGEEMALGVRSIELAYLDESLTQEQAAARLGVSRSTLYRLTRRCIQALTAALEAADGTPEGTST